MLVCGPRLERQMTRNTRHAEATIIHEMLHSLGLRENPPPPTRSQRGFWPGAGNEGRPKPAGTRRLTERG